MTRAAATPKKRRWTPEDDARLTELRAHGKPNRELSIALSRTEEAVKSRRHWLRQQMQQTAAPTPQQASNGPEQEPDDQPDQTTVYANGRGWTPSDDAQLAEFRRIGHADAAIAVLMGRTVAAVQMRISNLRARGCGGEIPTRKRPSRWTPERVAEARSLRAEGMTAHQIDRRLGTGAATVSRALRSPETIEDNPGEGVRVGRTVPNLGRAEAEVDAARAVLARAQARHREALEPILKAVREAVRLAGFVQDPNSEDDHDEDGPEWLVVTYLRNHGIDLRVRT